MIFKKCLMFTWMNANILTALGEKYWDNTNASSLHTHWWHVTGVSVYHYHKCNNSCCSFEAMIFHFRHHYYTPPACVYVPFLRDFLSFDTPGALSFPFLKGLASWFLSALAKNEKRQYKHFAAIIHIKLLIDWFTHFFQLL